MPDNLTVSLGADSTKLRTDLKLAEASVKSLKKEFTALADEAVKTGDKTKVIAFTPKVQEAEKAVVSLRKEITNTSVATGGVFKRLQELAHGTRPLNRVVREFSDASKAADIFAGSIGAAFGGFTGGVIGTAVAKVAGSIASMIDDTSKRLVALRQLGAEIGVKPIATQAAQELAVKAGVSAEDAATAMQSQTKLLEEARNVSTQAGGPLAGTTTVYKGGIAATTEEFKKLGGAAKSAGEAVEQVTGHLIRVPDISGKIAPALPRTYRGAAQEARDFTKPLELYDFEVKRFESSAKGMLQQQQFLNTKFLEWRKILGDTSTELNVLSKSQFGVPAETGIKLAETNLKNLDAQIKALEQTSRGATEKALSDDERLRISQAKLATQREETAARISSSILSARVAIIEFSVKANDVMTKVLDDMGASVTRTWEAIAAEPAKALAAWRQNMESWSEAFSGALKTMQGYWDAFIGYLRAHSPPSPTPGDTASAFPAFGDPSIPAMPTNGNAAGGYIRGPGSGTSDSILARLSNGEFVLNAGSVRRLGVGFLEGLNSFAAGGLVGASPLRFAAGGLASSSGRAVHLHLGAQSFALSGSSNVVDALVREAHGEQMRSTGVRPSWFASRPSGS